MNIVWREDYDLHSDKCYKLPCCEECSMMHGAVPVVLRDDGMCECVNCHRIGKPDKKQLKWLKDRQGTKILENEYCFSCKQNAVTVHQFKNPVTKKWQTAWGKCNNCGSHFIV